MGKLRRNRERDLRTQRRLRRAGWRVLVVWECQTADLLRLEARLRRLLNKTHADQNR